jgi:hypothetical protein
MLNKLIGYYSNCFTPFFIHSVFCGWITGVSIKSDGPIEKAQNMISYTTYGMTIGILYPISYPVCAIYTLFKNLKYIKD